jgi:tetratricopeptide (TPR) repeat protein
MTTLKTAITINFCPSCGNALQAQARFCSQCGKDIVAFTTRPSLNVKALTTIASLGLCTFLIAWYVQEPLVGKAPTEHFKGESKKPTNDEPLAPELQALKDTALANPKDKAGWVNYAQALGERLSIKDPPQGLIFEAITALRQILDIDPKDKDALLTMAEISFQQQAFAKSAEFYEKYLEIVPEDIDMRARYASSLSFTGKFDDSLKELGRVLSVKPDHFQALAYSAVTYAEMGDKVKSKAVGTQALAAAPNAEAKERFSKFLASLDKEPTPQRGNISSADSKPATNTNATFEPSIQAVVDQVKNNPVAGKKFVDAKLTNADSLTISLDNFPVSQMPPFVKDKFLGSIRAKAFSGDSPLKSVVLFDSSSQQTLETLTRE